MFCLWSAFVSFAFIAGLVNGAQSCHTRCNSHELIAQFGEERTTDCSTNVRSPRTLPLSLFKQHPDHPKVTYCYAEEGKFYTIMMIDPDAPSRQHPTSAPWLHWLVVNIPGESLITGKIQVKPVEEYAAPTPPRGSGYHHYELLLFQQEHSLSRVEPITRRANFDVVRFRQKYHLGKRIAWTGFLTKDAGNP